MGTVNEIVNIDIVLPCYNPAAGWETRIAGHFKKVQMRFPEYVFHLYLANDGSIRGFEPETVDKFLAGLPDARIFGYKQNRGKGHALRYAIQHCTSEYIIYTDNDFPYTDQSMENVIGALLSGSDVVVAVRDDNYQKNLPPFRQFMSKCSHWCNSWLLGLKVQDTQGGLKGFDKKGREVFLSTRIDGFLFDTEFINKASRRKDIILSAVPARIKDGLEISNMGMKVLRRESLNFLRILLHR